MIQKDLEELSERELLEMAEGAGEEAELARIELEDRERGRKLDLELAQLHEQLRTGVRS